MQCLFNQILRLLIKVYIDDWLNYFVFSVSTMANFKLQI